MPKSIFIVGMGPGIGAAVAERFGREGWTVVLGSRSADRLRVFVDDLAARGIQAHGVPVDATKPADLRSAMAQADRLAGGLTTVHFNAAYVRGQDLFSMTDAEVDGDLTINVAAGLHTIRAATALFADRGGTILITGGGLSLHPSPDWATLGASKAALRNVVEGLAGVLPDRGVHIAIATVATAVSPGSAEAEGAADLLWTLATDPAAGWEGRYPPIS